MLREKRVKTDKPTMVQPEGFLESRESVILLKSDKKTRRCYTVHSSFATFIMFEHQERKVVSIHASLFLCECTLLYVYVACFSHSLAHLLPHYQSNPIISTFNNPIQSYQHSVFFIKYLVSRDPLGCA